MQTPLGCLQGQHDEEHGPASPCMSTQAVTLYHFKKIHVPHYRGVSVKPGKPGQLNYPAQIGVDAAHHVITQIQSDHADKKDCQYRPSLLTNTIINLKEQGYRQKMYWLMPDIAVEKH